MNTPSFSATDLEELERVCFNLIHPKTSRKLDGEMGRKRLLKKLGQDTLAAMYQALKAAGRLPNA
ncbi:MAG: hypothetical protein ABIY63_13200 [Fibrobacteria bacterium]